MNSIYFVINISTMEHPDYRKVSKLRLYECIYNNFFFSTFMYGAKRSRALRHDF